MSASSPSTSDRRPARIPTFDEIQPGQSLPNIETEVTRQQLVKFAGAVDDYAQPHWDQNYMVEHGFPGVIAHGWLTFTIMCRVAVNWLPLEAVHYRAFKVRYNRPYFPGPAVFGARVLDKKVVGTEKSVDIAIWVDDTQGKRLAEGAMTAVFH